MWRRLLLVSFLLLPSSGGAEEARHAVGQVRVHGGHPVREVAEGDIFLQSFNDDCVLVPPRPGFADLPFAGTRGTAVEIEVDVIACPATPAATGFECRWEVRPAPPFDPSCGEPAVRPYGGHRSFEGSPGVIELRLPEETGIFVFSLTCDAGGNETGLESALYVTWSTPHPMMSVLGPVEGGSGPVEAWYRLAGCWGAGFGAGAETSRILATMKSRTYHYGQGNWRYGFGRRGAPGEFFFTVRPQTAAGYVIDDPASHPSCSQGNFCLCPWQGVVDTLSGCGFGNCRTFADALYFMAATLGVDGWIEPFNFTGANPNGFIVRPGAISLDSVFLANIENRTAGVAAGGPHPQRYRYYFTNHWLVKQCSGPAGTYCLFFDPTFDRIYNNPEELVGLFARPRPVKCPSGRNCVTFHGSDLLLEDVGLGYGSWSIFVEDHLPGTPPEEEKPEEPLPLSDVVFRVAHGERPGPAPALAVRATLPERQAELPVRAALLDAGGMIVANKPTWDATQVTFGVAPRVERRPGELLFLFSGEQIYRSGVDGPYTLVAFADDEGEAVSFSATSRRDYDHREFGELGAELGGVAARVAPCAQGDGDAECVLVEVTLDVRRRGAYVIALTLVSGSEQAALEVGEFELASGPRTREVEIRGVPAASAAGSTVILALIERPFQWLGGTTAEVVDDR